MGTALELLAKVPGLPRWLQVCWLAWVIVGVLLLALTFKHWPKDAGASSRAGDAGIGATSVVQESKGANSPNIVGNNNVINIAPATKPAAARGRLHIEDRWSKDTPEGVSEGIIFGNTGSRDTYVVAIQIRDRRDGVVASFRQDKGKVQPSLPMTIRPGNTVTVIIDLTKEQASRAHWVMWQSENETWNRNGWNERLHSIDVFAAESIDVSEKIDVKVVRAGTSGGTGGSKPDAK